jgi:hypothetical protein
MNRMSPARKTRFSLFGMVIFRISLFAFSLVIRLASAAFCDLSATGPVPFHPVAEKCNTAPG